MRHDFTSTIVAPATGHGGAISVIRVSGDMSFDIIKKIFKTSSQQLNDSTTKQNQPSGFTIRYGDILDNDEILDDVLVSYFRAPNSYTGEDSVEISCHASSYIQKRILELLIENGASPARPGEFTQRAFLNGKMDLSQAEAVADVINAETEAAHRLAINQMRGAYSEEINKLREKMLHFASMIELELDFGEEDVEFADRSELRKMVEEIKSYTNSLSDSFRYGNVIKNGVPVAIVGKPNVGKSTLLNALLKDDRAIVSDIPGTTRDVIEDTINIEGVLFRFIDTAGLRETADLIENLGIRRTYQKIEQADIVILLAEATDSAESINASYNEISQQVTEKSKRLLLVINKSDTLDKKELSTLKSSIECEQKSCIYISALQNTGIDKLTGLLLEDISVHRGSSNVVVSNIRHFDSLVKCSESLSRVLESLDNDIPEDLVAMDLRQAIHYLGEITGDISTDEILGNIFKNFCIGK